MNPTVRTAFLAAASEAVALIGRRDLGGRWQDDSALEGMTIGALACHLGRGILTVHWYLDMPEPDPPVVTAGEYFAPAVWDAPTSVGNTAIRAPADEMANAGWARLFLDVERALENLSERVLTEPADRRIAAAGRAVLFDEYLRTRCVELAVHLGDLCRSLGIPTPAVPDATAVAIGVLVEAAMIRHGSEAVLNALARRELDTTNVLRVL